jgi:hypothetical protein
MENLSVGGSGYEWGYVAPWQGIDGVHVLEKQL